MSGAATRLEQHLQRQLGSVLFGLEDTVHAMAIALIGRGHILLEGAPGLGKTLLSRNFATILGGTFKRIQGTADLMPTDITGIHVFNSQAGEFEFQPGPLFADVVLVDEINRAGPKTQSALLEAMEERQVSVDRDSFALADNFLVVATQNPREFEGTYPLPESQLDRFMLSTHLSYPDREHERRIIEAYNLPNSQQRGHDTPLEQLDLSVVQQARDELAQIHLSPELVNYALDIAAASRESTRIGLGLSSRGALALARSARVQAGLRGSDYVVPDDVKHVAPWVMNHRLVLSPDATLEGVTAMSEVTRILDSVPVPH